MSGVKDEEDSESDLNISTVSEESTAACGKVNICTPSTDQTHLPVFLQVCFIRVQVKLRIPLLFMNNYSEGLFFLQIVVGL